MRHWKTRIEAAVILLLPLVLTGVGWIVASVQNHHLTEQRFLSRARDLREEVSDHLTGYAQVLQGGVALFHAMGDVDRSNFRVYAERLNLADFYPGMQGYGFAQWVSQDERAAFESDVRAAGFPGFHIWPEGERSHYLAIRYLEPFDWRNRRAFGYDMFSEPIRAAAIRAAMDRGAPVASSRVTLVQETKEDVQAGFLIYAPVYRSMDVPLTVWERREALRGFIYAPFRVTDMMGQIIHEQTVALEVVIRDANAEGEDLMFVTPGALERMPEAEFVRTLPLEIYGVHWFITVISTPEIEAQSDVWLPFVMLTAGLAISFLLAVVARSYVLVRRQAEDLAAKGAELLQARAIAEGANADKTRFLAAASHDLRQPIQGLSIFLHLLGSKLTDDTQRELLARASDALRSVEEMLGGLMDVTALERGGLVIKPEPLDLTALLHDLATQTRPQALAHGLDLRERLPPGAIARADRLVVERIVRNLLNNAVKYTQSGSILLSLRRRKRYWVIQVWDTGPGIPQDKLGVIFEEFTRLPETGARRNSGLGLGLATVARLARLADYSMEVHSRVGRGSVFSVCLPAPVPVPEPNG